MSEQIVLPIKSNVRYFYVSLSIFTSSITFVIDNKLDHFDEGEGGGRY